MEHNKGSPKKKVYKLLNLPPSQSREESQSSKARMPSFIGMTNGPQGPRPITSEVTVQSLLITPRALSGSVSGPHVTQCGNEQTPSKQRPLGNEVLTR